MAGSAGCARWQLQRQFGEKAPAVIDQRLRVVAALTVLNLAHEDDVVALGVLAAVEALEHGQRALDDGRAAGTSRDGEGPMLLVGLDTCIAELATNLDRKS